MQERAAQTLAMDDHAWQNHSAGQHWPEAMRAPAAAKWNERIQRQSQHANAQFRVEQAREEVAAVLNALHVMHREHEPFAIALADIARGLSENPMQSSLVDAAPGVRARAQPLIYQHAEWLAHVMAAIAKVAPHAPTAQAAALASQLTAGAPQAAHVSPAAP